MKVSWPDCRAAVAEPLKVCCLDHDGGDFMQLTLAGAAHPAKHAYRFPAFDLVFCYENAGRLTFDAAGDQVDRQFRPQAIGAGR